MSVRVCDPGDNNKNYDTNNNNNTRMFKRESAKGKRFVAWSEVEVRRRVMHACRSAPKGWARTHG